MPGTLPLFPLGNVLFPEMLLPLHIFEPRYRLLVRRSLEGKAPFGVALLRSGYEIGSGEPHTIGTEARIVALSPLPDGRSYIVVRGERRFTVDEVVRDAEPYLVGRIRYLDELEGARAAELAADALAAFGQYLVAVRAVTEDGRADDAFLEELGRASPREVAYRIAAGLAVDAGDRQHLLELPTDAERLASERHLLERETTLLRDLLVRQRAHGEGERLN